MTMATYPVPCMSCVHHKRTHWGEDICTAVSDDSRCANVLYTRGCTAQAVIIPARDR